MEFKNSGVSAVETDGRTVTGFASIFGNVDLGGDVVHPGAFTKTLNERGSRIKHLWNHGVVGWDYFSTPPIAKILELREVGRNELPPSVLSKAPGASGGLLCRREYLQTERGNEVHAALVAGVDMEMSFGFDSVKRDYETLNPGTAQETSIRNLREVMLYDISDVNFGMNPATVADADGSKSFAFSDLEARLDRILTDARKAKSLPDSFHKGLHGLASLLVGFDSKSAQLFSCPECSCALVVNAHKGVDPDPAPEPMIESLSRAEDYPSLTELLNELTKLELLV